jgi:hypothetical protein
MPRLNPADLAVATPVAEPVATPVVPSTPVATSQTGALSQMSIQTPEIPVVAEQPLNSSAVMKDVEGNPFKRWIYLAAAVDSWRIWPRAFMSVYIILVYKVVTWFMTLPTPNLEQSGLVSVIVGAGAAWFGLYLGSSPRK